MNNWKKSLAMVSALAMVVTATSSFSFSANAVTNEKYEFENGTLDGATVFTGDKDGNDVANASGDLVFLENANETATVTVTVPSTGMYSLTIGTYTPYGNKTHNLLINDVDQGQISFEENTEGVLETELGMYKLNEGENTITVKSSWGWTYLDYITIGDATLTELTAQKTLSDSKATDQTKRLMSYLADCYGEHILSGQQEIYKYGPHDFEYEFEYIKDLTGEYPAIRGFDYMNECNPLYGSEDGTTDRMIDWAKNRNGIITASWHITVPKDFESYNLGDSVDWANATYVPKDTDFDPSKILEEGSKERQYYELCLEKLASSIQKLQDENIPIILRPLHEAEGGGGETGSWFWWGKSGSAVYKELWKFTYETLTETYDLHNIIWEWNSYAYSTSTNWYPGDEYVDLVAYDKYNCTDWSTGNAVLTHNDSAISGTFYNLVDMYGGKKMVAMSENDSIPTLENLLSEKAGWLYFCPWYDGGSDNINFLSNELFNTKEDLTTMYQSDYCITLDEIPADLYNTYSLDDWGETVEPNPDVTTPSGSGTVTTTTTKAEEKVVEFSADDCVATDDGFKFTVENPEDITKIEIIGSITANDGSTWCCGGGGVVVGINDAQDYAFKDYMFNTSDKKVTIKIDGNFKSGELDEDGNNIPTEGTITSDTIEITKWWTSSENEGEVDLDITSVKVYYKADTSTSTTTSIPLSTLTTIDGTVTEINDKNIVVHDDTNDKDYTCPIVTIPNGVEVGSEVTVECYINDAGTVVQTVKISLKGDNTTVSSIKTEYIQVTVSEVNDDNIVVTLEDGKTSTIPTTMLGGEVAVGDILELFIFKDGGTQYENIDGTIGNITVISTSVTTTVTEVPQTLTDTGKITKISGNTIEVVIGESIKDYKVSEDEIGNFAVGDTVKITVGLIEGTNEYDFDNPISIEKVSDTTTTTTTGDGSTVLGDANLDGSVKVNDVQLIRQSILHLIDPFEEGSQQFINADVTKDGSIKVNDVQLIRQYILHLIDSLDDTNAE